MSSAAGTSHPRRHIWSTITALLSYLSSVRGPDSSADKLGLAVAGHGSDADELGAAQLLTRTLDHVIAQHLAGVVSQLDVECEDDHFCVGDDGPGASPSGRGALLDFERLGQVARRIELESHRYGVRRRWVLEDLELLAEGERLAGCSERGTSMRVWPDAHALERGPIDVYALEQHLLGIHRVRPSLRVSFNGRRFDEPRGVEPWVAAHRCVRKLPVHHIEARRGTTEVEIAWAWLPAFGSARRLSYVNLRETPGDGSHVDGLLRGLARATGVSLAMARERCLALVSLLTVNPRFSKADSGRLDDPALERWIAELVEQQVG